MKRVTLAFLCAFATASTCAQGHIAIKDNNDAAVRAAAITSDYHLTTIKTECLYFDTDDEGANYLVRVREKHSKECGGDPETTNVVFFMRLRKRDGHATTTAYNTKGKFQALRPVATEKKKRLRDATLALGAPPRPSMTAGPKT
jgi:hypothetical protein